MNMWLTTSYEDYPVLFKNLTASNGGQAFGIFLLCFVASFVTKGFDFVRNYLEAKVWKNPNYQYPQLVKIIEQCECDENEKTSDAEEGHTSAGIQKVSFLTSLVKDFIRLLLAFLAEMFAYAMMLVAMTFSVVYFFAIVLGMAFGRIFFEKLSERMNITGSSSLKSHCSP
ncbi:Ctr copper transporter [Metschnikowia bicuspidata var. bicuspidata NRRL YB-4993]|uniref:Copper transport protein n=1 Tax=Metschnikowia bicuspidata var. bicuspidata NRRL YB-4993 TaxID=869754 RepID=A0A1A0HAW1_9ASCO|nr:Ctr copper transporter [Metschnikowia bicuspidata var. bicuspidata NRRL YB-4993]OBA21023.1 Ctr copper transporter [Metschnikowia bicuspidata var. bicuspidata NRRL YB-4993]